MSPLLAGFSCLSLLVALASGGQPGKLSDKKILEIKMKYYDLRDQIGKLEDQQQALMKLLEQHVKATTKPVELYVKVEVKGTLKQVESTGNWMIDAGGSTIIGGGRRWYLDFGAHKDLLELAEQQKGRTVVITGQLVLHRNNPQTHDEMVLVIATLKAAGE